MAMFYHATPVIGVDAPYPRHLPAVELLQMRYTVPLFHLVTLPVAKITFGGTAHLKSLQWVVQDSAPVRSKCSDGGLSKTVTSS